MAKAFRIGILAAALACSSFGLTACATLTSGPVAVADQTVLDEKAVIAAETAYTATARAAALAIRLNVVTNVDTIRRIGELDRQAYDALKLARRAYETGNATSYGSALTQANGLVRAVLALLNPAPS